LSYYNNQTNNQTTNTDTGRDVWQRQQDVLTHLKNAEEEIFKGIELQNPLHDQEFGTKRNLYSVTTILSGARKYHFVIQSLLTDKETTGHGSTKDQLYKKAFDQTQELTNQAVSLGLQNPIAQQKLNQAYTKIMETIYLLREEVSQSELDFKKKKNPYDAWKD
jgi:hypothetical protein